MHGEEIPTAAVPEIPEFDVWRDGAILRGRHRGTGRTIEADSPRRLALLACAVRIGAEIKRAIP